MTPSIATKAAGRAQGAYLLQRACDCSTKAAGTCEACAKKKRLQRKAVPGGGTTPPAYDVSPQLTQGGARLPAGLRGSLGALYGGDFADVRIHYDATSHAVAREVGARAFTLGQHIHFAAGEYRPTQRDGLRLLAHEIGHTLQQRGAHAPGDGVQIDDAGSALEREADAAADAALAGRPARVQPGGASAVQAKLLQRDIGQASGGSETATIDRSVDDNTTVHITRKVTEKPCDLKPATKDETPSDKIFYWDDKANAVGLRYTICNGRVRLSARGEISYDKVIDGAKNLLTTLQNNPALGQNIGNLLNNQINAATISGTGDITLTVDGILQASVQTGATAGTVGQQYSVRGVLKITPKGVSFTVTGGVDFSKTSLQSSTTYTLEGRVATEHFALSLRYEQIDTSQVGGPASSKSQVTGGLDIPLPNVGPVKDVTLGPTVTVDEQGHATFGGGIKGRFGGPEKTPAVRCFDCDCPPPLPEYSCTREVKKHEEVVEKPKDSGFKLLYEYNKDTPADAKAYANTVDSIATLVGSGFKVTQIWGYASPEGSQDEPKPPVPGFKGNKELSRRRAEAARARIADKAPIATLPAAEGHGELLGGGGEGQPETPDKDVTPQLVKLLEPLSDEQRLDVLGVDDAVRNDADKKAKALADIEAFVKGREAGGLKLATRPRWEKVFPFLRRVEVALHKAAVTKPVGGEGPKPAGCDDADIAYARANMPSLPPQRRLPQEECGK